MRKTQFLIGAAMGVAISMAGGFLAGSNAQERSWADALDARITERYADPKYRGFDFWIGEWHMNWRSQPAGEFYHQKEGTWTHQRVFPILGGKAIIELAWDRDKPEEASQRGYSIRYFDEARLRWVMAQNWPGQSNNGLAFLDQLIGNEHLGRMTVYSVSPRRLLDGTIANEHRRYNFTDIREGKSFRWDGSNTKDKGATWTTWTVIDALRQRDLDPYGAAGTSFPGVHNKLLCTSKPHGEFNGLEGVWQGTVKDADGESPAILSAGLLEDGCGVAASLEASGTRTFMTFGYADRFKNWVIFRLNDQPGTAHSYYVSKTAGDNAAFLHASALEIKDEFTPYYDQTHFEPAGALSRMVWTQMDAKNLVFQDQARHAVGEKWQMVKDYKFVRQ